MLVLLLAAVTVSAAFEGGSLGKVESVAPDHLRCAVKGQADQNGRNRQANWYYFELQHLPKGLFRFDLTDLVGEYNFKPGSHAVTQGTRPVYSYDNGHTWSHFSDEQVSWDDSAKELTVRFQPKRTSILIAHTPPYTPSNLNALLAALTGKPYFQKEIIGKSVHGRPIPLWTITDPQSPEAGKKVIWWMARQHAWETGTSWALEGGLRRLMEAPLLRKRFIFKILPCPDPDGMAEGAVRFNANGYDINRNWDAIDPVLMPEIAAERKTIFGWVDGGHHIDLFLAMHNTESVDYIDTMLSSGGPALNALAQRFQQLLNEKTVLYSPKGPRDAGESTTPGMKGRKTVHQELFAARKIPVFLMEQMVEKHPRLGRPPTVQDRLDFGAALVDVLTQTVEP